MFTRKSISALGVVVVLGSPLSVFADGLGETANNETGWELRPMEYRFQGGRLVHVDDPAGHMEQPTETRSMTSPQGATLERSGGN